jgi:hypothetical protein
MHFATGEKAAILVQRGKRKNNAQTINMTPVTAAEAVAGIKANGFIKTGLTACR